MRNKLWTITIAAMAIGLIAILPLTGCDNDGGVPSTAIVKD